MDMTQFAGSESNWLKAEDIKGKNVKAVIREVSAVHFDAQNDKPAQDKAALKFEGREKGVILNATNTKILINAYGKDSEKWLGKEIGLTTKEYEGFGSGIVVVILDADFDDDIPF
jgi:hypothetical protein